MTKDQTSNQSDGNLEYLKLNEEIARKFFDIEVSILSINNFKDFFEKLFLLIEEKFAIPHVWISIVNGSEVSDLINALESSELLKNRINLIGRNTFLKLINDERNPLLVNDSLKPYYKLLPRKRKYFVKSLAVAPLVYDENVIGSLNLGDYSSSRFEPGMDIFFLSQLAIKISLCLSNIAAREKLTHLTARDPLTHLLNRSELIITLERELSRASRYGEPLSIMVADIDHLKGFNDTYGHHTGDLILKHVTAEIKKVIRKEDIAARIGDDEFAVVFPQRNADEVERLSDELCHNLEKHVVEFADTSITVSVTCGIASNEDRGVKSYEGILKKAEGRILRRKKSKRIVKMK